MQHHEEVHVLRWRTTMYLHKARCGGCGGALLKLLPLSRILTSASRCQPCSIDPYATAAGVWWSPKQTLPQVSALQMCTRR